MNRIAKLGGVASGKSGYGILIKGARQSDGSGLRTAPALRIL